MTKKTLLSIAGFLFLAGNLSGQNYYTENTAAQFNAGSYNSTTYLSTVAAVSVGLEYYGRSDGYAVPGANNWFDASWKYRLPLVITSANAATLANYSVPVTVNTTELYSAGRLNSTLSDLRFTTAAVSGQPATLSYYIESEDGGSGIVAPGLATKIRVKVPWLAPGSNTLYMYFGSTPAAAASSMAGTLVMGDNFNGADGYAPSTVTWANTESAAPKAGSTRDRQNNRLRLGFGSDFGLRYYGLRTAAYYSSSAGRRYHADLEARTPAADSWSSVTLCPTLYSYSYDEQDWLRFAVKHSLGGATYSLEKKAYGTKTTFVPDTALGAGFHGVDILISSSALKVLLDGAEIYSGANTLSFYDPYLYLEAAGANNALEDFLFDNVYVTPYSSPEPVFDSLGGGQGRYYSSGVFVSTAINTGVVDTRVQNANWAASTGSGATLSVEMRAHNTDIALATFSAVARDSDPGVSGRYVQYRLTLGSSDGHYTPSLSTITLAYTSPPSAPSNLTAQAQSVSAVKWGWKDNSSGPDQEDGFRVLDSSGVLKNTLAAGVTWWVEPGLSANTPCSRSVHAYNVAGSSGSVVITRFTLPVPPDVSCDKSTGAWLSGALNCTNMAGFGVNGVAYYRYVWNTSPAYTWVGGENQWSSGILVYTAPSSGQYYLHVKSYSGDNDPDAGDRTYGPFWYDRDIPQVTSISPSSCPWTNVAQVVQAVVSDAGGSLLFQARYRWSLSSDRPSSWTPSGSIVNTSSSTLSYSQGTESQWYLHIEVTDNAGNTGYAYSGNFGTSGLYKIDKTAPSGTVKINNNAQYTPRTEVTLSLTYSDAGGSGVKEVQYKNIGGVYSAPELPQATTPWVLIAGEGDKQVQYKVTDNAGNSAYVPSPLINLNPNTSISGAAVTHIAGGLMGEPAEVFTASATLTWAPTGDPLPSQALKFVSVTTNTQATGAYGLAVATFAVPTIVGTYTYTVDYFTDGVYAASYTTGTITATLRPTVLIAEDVNASASSPFIVKATLRDQYTNTNVTGKQVTFSFYNGASTATDTAYTNGIGVASVTFTAPAGVAAYTYSASFAGDSFTYGPSEASAAVGVGLKVTTLVLSGGPTIASSSFTVSATLMDGATPVANSTITFVFNKGVSTAALTNSSGISTMTFFAPPSSGTYLSTASFAGDAVFTQSYGSVNVPVNRRPVSLAPDAPQGYVNADFQVRATLSDGTSGDKVPGKDIKFVFETSSRSVPSDANGVSTAAFYSGALVRTSTVYYYFSGDAKYGFADSTNAVSITKRPASLTASDASPLINSTFTVTAQLKDTAFTPTGIAGSTLTFYFPFVAGGTKTAVTDGLGVASVTYYAGLSTGSYDFTVAADTDAGYLGANDTGTISISLRPSVVSAYPRYYNTLNTIQLVADLKDGVTGDFLGNETIAFGFNNINQSTKTSISSPVGRAYAVYAGTPIAGTYGYYANFAGNSVYSAKSSTSSVVVSQRPVSLFAWPVSVVWGSSFAATGELRDAGNNNLLSSQTVKLVFGTTTTYSQTQVGLATAAFGAPASTGVLTYLAEFAGNDTYASASSTGTVTVIRRTAALTALPATKYALDQVYFSANFFDGEYALDGRSLDFYFMGSTKPATVTSGVATAGPFVAVSTPGTYSYTVSYPGGPDYGAQTSSSTLTVTLRPTQINVSALSALARSTSPVLQSTFTLSAQLVDYNTGLPVSTQPISFNLQYATFTQTAVTGIAGVAAVIYSATSTIGSFSYSAAFAGATSYALTSSTQYVTIILRPTVLEMSDVSPPANSTFTITATLKDYTYKTTLSTKPVQFAFMGSSKTAVTNGLGTAATTYVTLASTASYPITAAFYSDALFQGSQITKTVSSARRNVSVLTSDILNAVARDTFTVTAQLKDFADGYGIAGATISFSFTGSTFPPGNLTALTNSSGTARVVYQALASTGNYSYTASFAGSPLYNPNTNTSSVFVDRRTPQIKAYDLTGVPALSTFTASADLKDLGVTLSTRTLNFAFQTYAGTKTAVTNGVGLATTTFLATGSTGTFSYSAWFNGDALYKPVNTSANVGVILKPTVLEVSDVLDDAVVGLAFTGTAKLRDIEAGNALVLSTKTINFVFVATYTQTRNSITSVGVATASFTAPLTTGAYSYSASFAGDGIYGASQSTGAVIVRRRPVLFAIATDPVSPYAYRANAVNSSFTISGTLSDGKVAGLNLEGRAVRLVFKGITQISTTNSLGIATATFASTTGYGNYPYFGYFDGDASYDANNPADSEKQLTVITRPTTIYPNGMSNGQLSWNYAFWDQAGTIKIIDNLSGQGLGGVTINYYVQGSTKTGASNSAGIATSAAFDGNTLFQYTGYYAATATFSGNEAYTPSALPGDTSPPNDSNEGKIWVERAPVYFDVSLVQETFPDMDFNLQGYVYDWWNRAYPNSKIIGLPFRYRVCTTACGADCSAAVSFCNTNGWNIESWGVVAAGNIASATVHTPLNAADYPIDYYFPTTSSFVQWGVGGGQRVLRIGKRQTVLIPQSEPFTYGALMPITLKVKLGDLTQGMIGINGKEMDLVLINGTTQTVTTGGGGWGIATWGSGLPVGNYGYIARFPKSANYPDGDPTYMFSTTTGTIVIEKNSSVMVAEERLAVPAASTFTARATLNVIVGTAQQPAANKPVYFIFNSTGPPNIILISTTNSSGVATATFNAPWTPGEYNYAAVLYEDAEYKESSDTVNRVQVVQRRTSLTAENASVYILDSFVSSATLKDLDGAGAPGMGSRNISFVFHKSPDAYAAGVTSGAAPVGLATAAFSSPNTAGAYQYSATFVGETSYAAASDTKTVTVSRRPTQASGSAATTPTKSPLYISAYLYDVTPTLAASTTIADHPLKFTFNGSSVIYANTNSYGLAVATFTAPDAANTYGYTVAYEGTYDTIYAAHTFSSNVTIRKRNTVVSGYEVTNAAPGATFLAQAILMDEEGIKLAPYDVNFVFTGTATYTGTDQTEAGTGLAQYIFTAPLSTGVYSFTSKFNGDGTYEASNLSVSSVTVKVGSSTVSVPDVSVTVNDVFTASATLKGKDSGVGIANQQISFAYRSVSQGTAQTNTAGLAVKPITPDATGVYRLDADFAGSDDFYASAGSATVTVGRRESGLTKVNANTQVGVVFIATAALSDTHVVPSTPVAGREIKFVFTGNPDKFANTNSVGVATVSFTAPALGGNYRSTASFAGDAIYLPAGDAYIDVLVQKRDTSISLTSATLKALEVFYATATLIDVTGGGGAVTGVSKGITFSYKGQNYPTTTNSANGEAYAQFGAGLSSGPWKLEAVFDGSADTTYNSSTASSTVTVLRRDCKVIPDNISTPINDSITASATFYDTLTLETTSQKAVSFQFSWGPATYTALTNTAGLATYDFTAPGSSGTYKLSTFFTGDATYAPSPVSTSTVTVNRKAVQLSVANAAAVIDKVFTVTATLASGATPLSDGRLVTFTLKDTTGDVVFSTQTKAGGIAVATFTVTSSTGTREIQAVFNGDASYLPYASNPASATVTVAMRPTALYPVSASAVADTAFIATATLKDMDGLNVKNRTVSFYFAVKNATSPAVTSEVGVASVTLTADISSGPAAIGVSFAGDDRYIASSATLALTVLRRPVGLAVEAPATYPIMVKALDVFTATATLRDNLSGSTVAFSGGRFVFLNSTFTVNTNVNGVVVATFTAPAASGTGYSVYATFDGDVKYGTATLAVPVTVSTRASAITLDALLSVKTFDVFKATATLSDAVWPATKIAGGQVTFDFNWGSDAVSFSNGIGVATATYTAPSSSGPTTEYRLTGVFAGNATYGSTSTVIYIPVNRRNSSVQAQNVSARVLDVFKATATFYDAVSGSTVSSRTVKFWFQSDNSTRPAVTYGLGQATYSYTASTVAAVYTLNAWFDGDEAYNPAPVDSKTVALSKRNSYLVLSAPVSSIITSSIAMTAELRDSVSGSTVAPRTLTFYFQGSSQTADTTAPLGRAATSYTTGASSGTHQITVSFTSASDQTYNTSSSGTSILMLRYPTSVSGDPVSVVVKETLTAAATLRNTGVVPSTTVASRALNFVFQGSTFTGASAVTDPSGVGIATFTAVSTGTYPMAVSFPDGDALYAPSSATFLVTVNRRTAGIAANPVATKILEVFTATATLQDALPPYAYVAGASVRFEFFQSTFTDTRTAATGADGVAVSTFTAPLLAGYYNLKATFDATTTYYSVSVTTGVTALKAPSYLALNNAVAVIDEPFFSTAALTGGDPTIVPVSGATITFSADFAASSSAITGAFGENGKARVSFTANASSGPHQLDASYPGDGSYFGSSSSATLTVNRRPLRLSTHSVSGTIDEVFTASATLTDVLGGYSVAGATVSFVFRGSTFTAASSPDGIAVATFTSVSSGTFALNVNFDGNNRYLSTAAAGSVPIARRPFNISVTSVTLRVEDVFTATATLTDVLDPADKINGRQVALLFQGATTWIDSADGQAASTFTSISSGAYRLDASFAGDPRYMPGSSSATIAVLRRLSDIGLNPVTVRALNVFAATATLTDTLEPSKMIAGRTVSFVFENSTFTTAGASTGFDSVAVSTFAAPVSSGSYRLAADFAGDSKYDGKSTEIMVQVLPRPVRILVESGSAYPFEQYIATATLVDDASSGTISNRTLKFTLTGSPTLPVESVTSGGKAYAAFIPPGTFGPYELKAEFAGDLAYAAATYSAGLGTGTVTVLRRPTRIDTLNVSATAKNVFIATATFIDVRLSSPIAGEPVVFTFATQFETQSSTATSFFNGAAIIATAAFNAPISSGTYAYGAAYNGGPVYDVSSATGSVAVATRETRVLAYNTNANVNEPFLLEARLVDPAYPSETPDYYVKGVPVKFVFRKQDGTFLEEHTEYTDAVGIASATFQGPDLPTVYNYTASFAGDITYSSSTAGALVKVGILTSLVAFNVETYAMKNFNVNAKLTDYLSVTLDDKPIRFRFDYDAYGLTQSTGYTNWTGISGVAVSSFTAPPTAGTYTYTARFDGDSLYSASNATATVIVQKRPSSILMYPASTLAFSSFTARVALLDVLSPANVVGFRDMTITFNGNTKPVQTGMATGEATAEFFVPFSSGPYNFTAHFDGDETYTAADATGTVNVTLRPTTMISYNITDVLGSSTFTARVQVKDSNNLPVPGLDVDFSLPDPPQMGGGVTNAQGIAETVFTAAASSGVYYYSAKFWGDSKYSASSASGSVTVGPRPTMVFVSDVSVKVGSPVELAGKLVDVNRQAGVEGRTLGIYYSFANSTQPAATDAVGLATAAFAAQSSTGTYYYLVTFEGDGVQYTGSFATAAVTIGSEITQITARDDISVKIYEPLDVYATLKNSAGWPLPQMPVVFTFGVTDKGGTTDSVGKATAAFSTLALPSTGAYNYSAKFPGNTVYVMSSDTSNVVNILRRDTSLAAVNVQTTPNKTFTVEARLNDNVNGSALAGMGLPAKDILFTIYWGTYTSAQSGVTTQQGVSTMSFTAPAATGTYVYTAVFADNDPVYMGRLASGTVTVVFDDGVGTIKTKLKAEPVNVYIKSVFKASATLTATDLPVPEKFILFEYFDGSSTQTAPGYTDAVGLATASFTAPASTGIYAYIASFAGDGTYSAAGSTGMVAVSRYPSVLTAASVIAYLGDGFTARAVLKDGLTQAPLSGRDIVFEFFNGLSTVTAPAVTGSTGSAEAFFDTPAVPGNYSYRALFAGTTEYVSAAATAQVLIASKGSSTFLIGYEVFIGTGEVFAASATLTSKGYPVPGKPVAITFNSVTRVSTTNALGLAVSTFTAPSSSGTVIYQASFSGDFDYGSALATAPVNAVFRKTAEPPVTRAVIEDSTVTITWTAVTKYQEQVTGYVIEKADSLRGKKWEGQGYVPSTAPALGFSLEVDTGAVTYLKVRTKLADGQESGTPLIVEVPPQAVTGGEVKPNYYYMSRDENAWVKVPGEVMDRVSASTQTAPFALDISTEANPGFSVSYNIRALGASTDNLAAALKSEDRKGVRLTISYAQLRSGGFAPSASSGQMAMFQYNGVEWLNIGGEVDLLSGEIYTYSNSLGRFAVRFAPLAGSFSLSKVAGRIFTPDGSGCDLAARDNCVKFTYQNPDSAEVTIRIFDITGAQVRRNLEYVDNNNKYWDGREQGGAIVKGGVYIYQIETGDKVVTGTVVVAK